MFRRRNNRKNDIRQLTESIDNMLAQLDQVQSDIDLARVATDNESVQMKLDWSEAKLAHTREKLETDRQNRIRLYHALGNHKF